jgi:flagellar motor protein MotB
MGKLPIDLQNSTRWAIASVESAGMILVGHTTFDLVNLHTGRAHRLELAAAGISGKLPISGSFSMSNYTPFTTRRPVNFQDFDARGARQTTAAVIVYSMSYLTIFDGLAYISPTLCQVKMAGWGPSIPSIGIEHGVTEVIYGDGNPKDSGGFQAEPELVIPSSKEEVDIRVQITQNNDSLVIRLQGDSLFDFDKYLIRPDAEQALKQAGSIIRSLPIRRVDIDGHADGKGDEAYNLTLSTPSPPRTGYGLRSPPPSRSRRHTDLVVVLRRQLLEPDRCGEAGPPVDDQHVEYHRFALHRLATHSYFRIRTAP